MAIEFKNIDDLLARKHSAAETYGLALAAERDALANYRRALDLTQQAYAEFRGAEIAFNDAFRLYTEELREAAE